MKRIILFITFFLLGFIGTVFSRRLYNASDFIYIDDNENTNVNEAILNINNIIKTKGKTEFLGSVNSIEDADKYSELYAFSYYINGYSYGDLPNYRFTHSNITSIDNATFSLEYSYDSTKSVLRLYKIVPKDNVLTFHIESGLPDQLVLIGIKK